MKKKEEEEEQEEEEDWASSLRRGYRRPDGGLRDRAEPPGPKTPHFHAGEVPSELNARSATLVLLASLAAEICCGALFGITTTGASGQARWAPLTSVITAIVGGICMLLVSRGLVCGKLQDTSPNGAAWVRGPWLAIAAALTLGLLVGVCAHLLNLALKPQTLHRHMTDFTRMAFTPGLQRVTWVLAGLLIAPPTEELLFRGVVYGGYRTSFGPRTALVLTTLLFVGTHLPQAIHSVAAVINLTGLGLATLWCRLHWSAVGPAIAAHMGYNGSLALLFLLFSSR